MRAGPIIAWMAAGLFGLGCLLALIWGVAVWFGTWLPPVAVPFALAGFLAFMALVAGLIGQAYAARPAPAAAAGGIPLSMVAATLSGTPSPAEIEALSRVCTTRPVTGMATAFALGIIQGLDLDKPRRK